MQKALAVSLAVLFVLAALLPQSRRWLAARFVPGPSPVATTTAGALPDLGLSVPVLTLDNIGGAPVAIEAWNVFQAYRKAAKEHDLPALASLSYQLSDACQAALADASKTAPCYELMDSVVFFTSDFAQKDFVRVAYDAKQIILATDYRMIEGADEPIKAVIYFVRDPGPKVLGIRFCIGNEGEGDECVETAPDKRDANKNGWWDDVEAFFRK